MSELGEFLRQKRLEQGISIDKLQEETKIRKRYIEAIEQGDYNILPGQFYARAFIKSYAEALGLNAEQVIKEYSKELPEIPTGPVEATPPRRTKSIQTSSLKVGKWVSRLVFYAFFLMICFVVYLAAVQFFGNEPDQTLDPDSSQGPGIDGTISEGDDGEEPNGNDQDQQPPDDIKTPPVVEEPNVEPTWTYVDTVGSTSTYRYENADKLDVTIKATSGDVWLEIREEGPGDRLITSPGGVTVRNNQEQTWELSEYNQVNFRFGNTRSVEILINGEPVDLSSIPNRNTAINLIIQYEPNGQQ